jgi:hypothetical protein
VGFEPVRPAITRCAKKRIGSVIKAKAVPIFIVLMRHGLAPRQATIRNRN